MNLKGFIRLSIVLPLISLIATSRLATAASDDGTLTVGEQGTTCGLGFVDASGYDPTYPIGSYSPTELTGGDTVAAIIDLKSIGCSLISTSILSVSGFSSNPGSSWLTSITCNGVTNSGSAASSYSYSSGSAHWYWSQLFGLLAEIGSNVSCAIVHS